MRNTGRISVLPAVLLDGTLTVAAQPGSFLWINIKYFLEEGLVSPLFLLTHAPYTYAI
jgi:hypothetical protein